MIKIYHYSNSDFKGYIDPGFFGANSYTRNSGRISGVKRVYFYLDKNNKEYYFNGCQFLYITEIDKNKLYDIGKDILKLAGRNDILRAIKNKGYIGIIGNNGFNCICLFKAVKIIKRLTLTKAGKYAILKHKGLQVTRETCESKKRG